MANKSSGTHTSGRKKDRRGDTSRTSNQGQKLSSGGSTETNNQGRAKGGKGKM